MRKSAPVRGHDLSLCAKIILPSPLRTPHSAFGSFPHQVRQVRHCCWTTHPLYGKLLPTWARPEDPPCGAEVALAKARRKEKMKMNIARSLGTPSAKVGPASRRPLRQTAAVCSEHEPEAQSRSNRAAPAGWPAPDPLAPRGTSGERAGERGLSKLAPARPAIKPNQA